MEQPGDVGLAGQTLSPAPGTVMRLVCRPREEEGAIRTKCFGSGRSCDCTLPAPTARGAHRAGACLTTRIMFAPAQGWCRDRFCF